MRFKEGVLLTEIAAIIGAALPSGFDEKSVVMGINSLESAANDEISFLTNRKYAKYVAESKALAIISNSANIDNQATLVVDNPRLALSKLLFWYKKKYDNKNDFSIHPTCTIAKSAKISLTATIKANCVIGENVVIHDHVLLEPGVVIGDNSIIGNSSIIKANVSIYDNVTIGHRCVIHANSVIGSDGFGFVSDKGGRWLKLPHLGGVMIGDDVEIGSNTSVDRGLIADTIIGDNVIIDNLVQIAHNVKIGNNTAIAGCTAVAGSTQIGKNCMIGGGSNIAGHLNIADQVVLTATSSVSKNITTSGVYSSGFPVTTNSKWRRYVVRVMAIDKVFEKIKKIENKLKDLNLLKDVNHE
jgi:UDP-3-O-[3-hydroxymyristoyl] glucosamine N-acyltransferase